MSHSTFGLRLAPKKCQTFSWKGRSRGLTLLELVVVLGILAILAGVTIQSLEPIADQARYDATVRTLEAVDRAIYQERLDADGRVVVRGFVADMGRLPRIMADHPDPLAELWDRSIFAGYESPGIREVAFETLPSTGDINVPVAGGWNGPYLQRPRDQNVPDGWGRAFVGTSVRPAGQLTIASLGSDQMPGSNGAKYGEDLIRSYQVGSTTTEPFDPESVRLASTLSIIVRVDDSVVNLDNRPDRRIGVFVLEPDDTRESKSNEAMLADAKPIASTVTFSIPDVTVGPRTVVVGVIPQVDDPPIIDGRYWEWRLVPVTAHPRTPPIEFSLKPATL